MDHICPSDAIFETKGLPIVWHNIEAPRVYLSLMQQEIVIYGCLLQIILGVPCLEVTINDKSYCRSYEDG